MTHKSYAFSIFLCGLCNNIVYIGTKNHHHNHVVYLSAAQDILRSLDSNLSKGAILLADIVPALLAKLVLIRLVGRVEYRELIHGGALLTICSLLVVAFSKSLPCTLVGIMMASASSGMGESSFLALSTHFDPNILVSWASGTGMAGLSGSLLYAPSTNVFGIPPKAVLIFCLIFPVLLVRGLRHINEGIDRELIVSDGNAEYVSLGPQSHHLIIALFIPLFLVYFSYSLMVCNYTVL